MSGPTKGSLNRPGKKRMTNNLMPMSNLKDDAAKCRSFVRVVVGNEVYPKCSDIVGDVKGANDLPCNLSESNLANDRV